MYSSRYYCFELIYLKCVFFQHSSEVPRKPFSYTHLGKAAQLNRDRPPAGDFVSLLFSTSNRISRKYSLPKSARSFSFTVIHTLSIPLSPSLWALQMARVLSQPSVPNPDQMLGFKKLKSDVDEQLPIKHFNP